LRHLNRKPQNRKLRENDETIGAEQFQNLAGFRSIRYEQFEITTLLEPRTDKLLKCCIA